MMETVYLDITGMHCPDCPAKVERSVSKLNGVRKVKVDYETESGYVTYNKKLISLTDIINRIDKLEFEAKTSQTASFQK